MRVRLKNFYLSKVLFFCPSLFKNKISTKQNIVSTEIAYKFSAPKVPVSRRNKATNSRTSTDPFSAATKTLVFGNLFKLVKFFTTFFNKNQKTSVIFFFIFDFIPKWQTSCANVMTSLKSLNELPSIYKGLQCS